MSIQEKNYMSNNEKTNANLPRRSFLVATGAMMGCSIAGIPQNSSDTSNTTTPPDTDSGEIIDENKDTGTVTEQF